MDTTNADTRPSSVMHITSYNPSEKYYPVDVDWTGRLYCGIKLDWNYDNKKSVDISIQKYAPRDLH